eukprot:2176828-Alexandrium_andersonii.AAC.1
MDCRCFFGGHWVDVSRSRAFRWIVVEFAVGRGVFAERHLGAPRAATFRPKGRWAAWKNLLPC